MKAILPFFGLLMLLSSALQAQDEDPDKPNPWAFVDVTINTMDTYHEYMGDPMSPLPCELLDFSGIVSESGIELSWITVSETNAREFIVEANYGGVWEHIDRTSASGNSNSVQDYELRVIDKKYSDAVFRLILEDHDGTCRVVSNTVAQKLIENEQILSDLVVATSGNMLDLVWHSREPATTEINIWNTAGQNFLSLQVESSEGINSLSNVTLTPGQSYIIVISSQNSQLTFQTSL